MNSIWNNNIALFCTRFPALAQAYGITPHSPEPPLFFPLECLAAKNGQPTIKENGKFWHSQYNPEREAMQTVQAVHKAASSAFLFCSCGLGYAPVTAAQQFPHDSLIIAEPQPAYFFAALTVVDWTPVFVAENIVLALQAGTDEVIALVERAGGFAHTAICAQEPLMAHAEAYYRALFAAIDRAKQKALVNTNTLERFSKLWLRNACHNLPQFGALPGVNCYRNHCPPALDALVLAAGPTLDTVLPHLVALKKRMLIICVDTALRACLRAGVEPDFVVLVDPQYYAARHLAGLASPSSVLITESAAYPSVYRFQCKKIVLCSSLFPLGKYFERALGSKGALAAGGSVSTTAWDFARLAGATDIFMAGLDLGYPDFQTHIRGSTFEEKIHTVSLRTRTAETAGTATLFGANMTVAKDYNGRPLLTDDRMQLFGWWFENKLLEYPQVRTYSLSPKSLAIPNMHVADVQTLLSRSDRSAERAAFFAASEAEPAQYNAEAFIQTYRSLTSGLDALYQLAKRGKNIAEAALSAHKDKAARYSAQLARIDEQILHSDCKEVAALVFPTERQLEHIYANTTLSSDTITASFQRSTIIYRELQKGISTYRSYLPASAAFYAK